MCTSDGIILCKLIGEESVIYEGLVTNECSAIAVIILLFFLIKCLNKMVKTTLDRVLVKYTVILIIPVLERYCPITSL